MHVVVVGIHFHAYFEILKPFYRFFFIKRFCQWVNLHGASCIHISECIARQTEAVSQRLSPVGNRPAVAVPIVSLSIVYRRP